MAMISAIIRSDSKEPGADTQPRLVAHGARFRRGVALVAHDLGRRLLDGSCRGRSLLPRTWLGPRQRQHTAGEQHQRKGKTKQEGAAIFVFLGHGSAPAEG